MEVPVIANEDYELVNARFAHIGARLRETWGNGELIPYIETLLHDTRNGKRKGFPLDIVMALTSLRDAHREEFPQFSSGVQDLWADNS